MPQRIFLFAALCFSLAFGQATPTSPCNCTGLDLLNRVSSKYRNAKSYYIESVEERTMTSEYRHDWQRTVLLAAGAPDKRFHYEGRSDHSNAISVSDGETVWTYHGSDQRYTAKLVSASKPENHRVIPVQEMAEFQAEHLRQTLGALANPFNSAEQLRDASLKMGGRKLHCYVVRVRSANEKRPSPNFSFEKTIWIDKKDLTIVRIAEHRHITNRFPGSGASDPMDEDVITTFPNTTLDGPIADNLFHFVPPSEAILLDEFPDPRTSFGSNLVGVQAPPLKLKSADGRIESLESLRGKPVLIDIWATWCAPCVEALPKFDKLYHEATDKGLVMISIDRDQEAAKATDFLSKKGYTWPNFHDDGEIEKLLGSSGIPRVLLIDAQGKVVYDAGGTTDDALRTQIVKLGAEYTSFAPRKDNPCPASE